MKKVFYEKVGRRYIPVSEYDSDLVSSFPEGSHLVVVRPGATSTHYKINPDYVPLIAAGKVAKEGMLKALVLENTYKISRPAATAEEKAAWDNLLEVWGEEARCFKGVSMSDVAEAGVRALEKETAKLLSINAVKEAYEHFLFVARLCYENKETETG